MASGQRLSTASLQIRLDPPAPWQVPTAPATSAGRRRREKGLSVASRGARECGLEVLRSTHLERPKRYPQLLSCYLGVLPEEGIDFGQRVSHHCEPSKLRDELSQDLQTLAAELFIVKAEPRHVPFGMRQARN